MPSETREPERDATDTRPRTDSESSSLPSGFAPFLRAYFDELEARGVHYCVTRNFVGLPEQVDGDLDILIRPGQRQRAEAAVDDARAGYFTIRRVERDGHVLLFVAHDEELRRAAREGREAEILELDLVTGISWSNLPILDPVGVLSRAEQHHGIWVASAADEAAHVLCHALLDKRDVKPGYRAIVESATQQLGDGALSRLDGVFGSELVERMRVAFAAGDDTLLLGLRLDMLRQLIARRADGWLRWIGFECSRWLRRVRAAIAPPGILIATAGPDGAGKSTLLAQLGVVLGGAYSPIRDQYMGWRNFVLPTKRLLAWLQQRLTPPRENGEATPAASSKSEYSHEPTGPVSWTHNVSVLHYFADLWARYLLQIRPVLSRGGVVLCDRYFFDVLVQQVAVCDVPALRAVLLALTPRPTVTALLSGDPEVISARKREMSPSRTAEMMASLSVLSGSRGVLDLDAQKPLEENVEAVLRQLFPRWRDSR